MKHTIKSTIIATAFAASTLAASGAEAISYDGSTFTPRADGPFTIGNLILIGGSDLSVSALGIQDLDNSGNGLTATDGFANGYDVTVGIWNADGSSLLASVTLDASATGSTEVNSYRYLSLGSNITLAAGTQYLIGATVGNGIEFFYGADNAGVSSPYSTGGDLSIVGATFAGIAGGAPVIAAPTSGAGGSPNRWAPANFQYTAVPEPSAGALLLGLGSLALVLRRRR